MCESVYEYFIFIFLNIIHVYKQHKKFNFYNSLLKIERNFKILKTIMQKSGNH